MKAYVYTDASLGRYAGRFVWLSINTEDQKNAPFLKRFPIPALPTILVLDPKRDEVELRFVGGATVPQLKKLLDEAEHNYRSRSASDADDLLVRGERAASGGNDAEAAKLFEQAVQRAAGVEELRPHRGSTHSFLHSRRRRRALCHPCSRALSTREGDALRGDRRLDRAPGHARDPAGCTSVTRRYPDPVAMVNPSGPTASIIPGDCPSIV